MTAPQQRPARPREPRPELVAAIQRRREITRIRGELEWLSRRSRSIREQDRTDQLLDRLNQLTGKDKP